jgi:hypothetical protein
MPQAIERLLNTREAFQQSISVLRGEIVFNVGDSAQVAARELVKIADDVGKN